MHIEPDDTLLVDWARQRGWPCYYTVEHDLPERCLKIQCGPVCAYFHGGELVRLRAQADRMLFDDMFAAMTLVFSLSTRTRRSKTPPPPCVRARNLRGTDQPD